MNCRENAIDLLQRYRRDRRVLLDFILSGSLIKKVVMPPGAVTLDDVDLDQVSIDYVLNCAKKSEFNLVLCVVFHPFSFAFVALIMYYSIIQVKCLSFQKLLEIIMIILGCPKWYICYC